MIKYKNPKDIYSPKDAITEVNVLYDDPNSVSIAKIKWNGKYVIGIRWNVAMREWKDQEKLDGLKECFGVPVSRGYPTWFILPNEMADSNSKINKVLKEIKLS